MHYNVYVTFFLPVGNTATGVDSIQCPYIAPKVKTSDGALPILCSGPLMRPAIIQHYIHSIPKSDIMIVCILLCSILQCVGSNQCPSLSCVLCIIMCWVVLSSQSVMLENLKSYTSKTNSGVKTGHNSNEK